MNFPVTGARETLEQALYFRGDLRPLADGHLRTVAGDTGAGVGIGAAANRDKRDGARVVVLDRLLGVAGPVTADLVVSKASRSDRHS